MLSLDSVMITAPLCSKLFPVEAPEKLLNFTDDGCCRQWIKCSAGNLITLQRYTKMGALQSLARQWPEACWRALKTSLKISRVGANLANSASLPLMIMKKKLPAK